MAHVSGHSAFRFLDLPQEIQDKILSQNLHVTELKFDFFKGRFSGQSNLAIERTCRKILEDCRSIRRITWPKELVLHDRRCPDYRSFATRQGDDDWLTYHTYILGQCYKLILENLRLSSSWNWKTILDALPELYIIEVNHAHRHVFEGNQGDHYNVFDMLTAQNYDESFQRDVPSLAEKPDYTCFQSPTLKQLSKLLQAQLNKSSRYSIRVICDHRLLRRHKNDQLLLHTVVERRFRDGDMTTTSKTIYTASFDD